MLAVESFLETLHQTSLRRIAFDHLRPGHNLQHTPMRPNGYHEGRNQEEPGGSFHGREGEETMLTR